MLSRIFVRVQFDNKNYLLSEKKLLLSGDIELNPGPAEIPNPFTYGRGFMCASNTYFYRLIVAYGFSFLLLTVGITADSNSGFQLICY